MPLASRWPLMAAGAGLLLVAASTLGLGQVGGSPDASSGRVDVPPAVAAPVPMQGSSAVVPAPVQAPSGAVTVDESALRYFARQGDARRLEIEIERLRRLYPQWTPPADPLSVPVNADRQLEAIWQLYSEGKLAEAREAVARRQSEEPGWQPPADLLERLALAEARERLIAASQIRQYETVIRTGSENPQLLTCGEVDVLWRVAEAFARTARPDRARDAYRYILGNCDDPQERLATVQNASQLLDAPLLDELLAMERVDASGVGEFAPLRDDLARNLLAKAGEDASVQVSAEQLATVERLAQAGGAADGRLLGWYFLKRENAAEAEKWFRGSLRAEDNALAAQGLALALTSLGRHADAEEAVYRWRGENEDTRKVYLAAAANLLGVEPRPLLTAEVLQRIVAEAYAARDVATARQLGWYARAWEQHRTAGEWFSTALGWDPEDEPSAYGLALTRSLLADKAGLAEIKRAWSARSERIRQVGTAGARAMQADAPLPRAAQAERAAAPERQASPPPVDAAEATAAVPQRRPSAKASSSGTARRGCGAYVSPRGLTPEAALQQGWCLMEANRAMEAAQAFEAALASGQEQVRRDAAWGQSLAYLRMELVDQAAVSALAEPQDPERSRDLQASILAQRATAAFESGRYVEALLALDQRAAVAPERIDLMVLRGYAYLKLERLGDAKRVFQSLAGTGDREGLKGLAIINDRMNPGG